MATSDSESREMSDPVQMVVFGNESVEATFRDGSKIQMTGCATAFAHDQPNTGERHQLHGMRRTFHRTQFTTSAYQLKVMKALAFKNRYCSRPYLYSTLLGKGQATTMYEDIAHAQWPLSLTDDRCDVISSCGGSTSLTSLDGHASLTLAAHGRSFSVRYLAKMSGGDTNRHNDNDNSLDESTDCETPRSASSADSGSRWKYTRVSTQQAVDECPPCWQHPLQLLIQFRQEQTDSTNNKNVNNNASDLDRTPISDILERKLKKLNLSMSVGEDTTIHEEEGRKSVFTKLPPSLSLSCSGKQLHRWRQVSGVEDDSDDCYMYGQVKVVYTPTAVFRVVSSQPRHVEIYPRDGSVLVSRGLDSGYYDHYLASDEGDLDDRTYSIKCPPPDTGLFEYSVKQLLLTAERIARCAGMMLGTPEELVCWKASPTITPPANQRNVIIDDVTVEGVANFQATRNGRVRVLFTDRTRVDLRFDYEKAKQLRRERGLDFDVGDVLPVSCRLMNQTAEFQNVSLRHSSEYDSYVEPVKDWVSWVVSPPDDRTDTFVLNARQMARQACIEQELKKIECFKYILDNVVLNPVEDVHADDNHDVTSKRYDVTPKRCDVTKGTSRENHVVTEEALSPALVADILRRNKMAIQEIERFTSEEI